MGHVFTRLFGTAILFTLAISLNVQAKTEAGKTGKSKKPGTQDIQRVTINAQRVSEDLTIVDGDTIRFRFRAEDGLHLSDGSPYVTTRRFGDTIRLAGYDTPEKFAPFVGMFFNQSGGKDATQAVTEILTSAKEITIYTKFEREDNGRLLGYLEVKDESRRYFLGEKMISTGHAYEAVLFYRERAQQEGTYDPRMKPFENRMIAAWSTSPIHLAIEEAQTKANRGDRAGLELAVSKIPFMAPYLWRQFNNHQVCTDAQTNKKVDCRRLLTRRSDVNKMAHLLDLGKNWFKLSETEKKEGWNLARSLANLKIPGVNRKYGKQLPHEFGIQKMHDTDKFVADDFVWNRSAADFWDLRLYFGE